jgi:hypothetical protein
MLQLDLALVNRTVAVSALCSCCCYYITTISTRRLDYCLDATLVGGYVVDQPIVTTRKNKLMEMGDTFGALSKTSFTLRESP